MCAGKGCQQNKEAAKRLRAASFAITSVPAIINSSRLGTVTLTAAAWKVLSSVKNEMSNRQEFKLGSIIWL